MKVRIVLFLFILLSFRGFSFELDSLLLAYSSAQTDSLKARACLEIGDYYENRNIEKSITWGLRAIKHAEATKDQLFVAKVLNHASYYYHKKGDRNEQIKLYLRAYRISEKNGFNEMLGGLASNIGSAYIKSNDSKQALTWLEKSIDLKRKYSTKDKLAISISNLGAYHFDEGRHSLALKYYKEALAVQREMNNQEMIALDLINIGDCYLEMDKPDSAEILFKQALSIERKLDDQFSVARTLLNLSWLYEEQDRLQEALLYADSAYRISKTMSFRKTEHEALLNMADINMSLGNKDKAYEQLKKAFELWQELHTEEATNSLNNLRTKYETETVQNENLLLKKDGEINEALISRQKTIIAASVGGLLVLIVLVYFLFKWNRDKRKQNTQLSEQKKLVEEKNREVLDSINYARRIQAAILPPNDLLKELLPGSFIFYRPKDVVAGDFYWLEKTNEGVLFAVADCTGHGVPGALVSVFCNNGLNRSVREHGLTIPGEILDKTREIVLEEFQKGGQEVNDGMDIALCLLKGNKLYYAGAHNPLWIIRNGGLIDYRASKQPIGKFENPEPYKTHEIDLQNGDLIYLFTDGIVDQFGGENGKKLKSVHFKNFLLSLHDLDIAEQEQSLDDFFNEWKGEHEQVDDVCVMGLRV